MAGGRAPGGTRPARGAADRRSRCAAAVLSRRPRFRGARPLRGARRFRRRDARASRCPVPSGVHPRARTRGRARADAGQPADLLHSRCDRLGRGGAPHAAKRASRRSPRSIPTGTAKGGRSRIPTATASCCNRVPGLEFDGSNRRGGGARRHAGLRAGAALQQRRGLADAGSGVEGGDRASRARARDRRLRGRAGGGSGTRGLLRRDGRASRARSPTRSPSSRTRPGPGTWRSTACRCARATGS